MNPSSDKPARAEEIFFRCPECGSRTLMISRRIDQKAVISEDETIEVYGGENDNPDHTFFGCWECDYVIEGDGGLIRRTDSLIDWLRTNSAHK